MIAIFLFYNHSTGKQASLAFSDEFRHCNIVMFDGDYWVNSELDLYGIHHRVLKVGSYAKFLEKLKLIKELTAWVAVWVRDKARVSWKPWWVRSCNEFDRYISGVDVGFTFNPTHLYKKLLKYNCKRNFEVLSQWRRANGYIR